MTTGTVDEPGQRTRRVSPEAGSACVRPRCDHPVDAGAQSIVGLIAGDARGASSHPVAAACARAVDDSPHWPLPSPMTVLLADDSAVLRVILATMLESLGMQVVVAEDGGQALQRIEEHAVDIVLMDIDMPRLDGLEATRRIRAREARLGLPAVPILSISGATRQADRHDCLAAGMNDTLCKPFTRDALLLRLHCWSRKASRETDALDFGDATTPLGEVFGRA